MASHVGSARKTLVNLNACCCWLVGWLVGVAVFVAVVVAVVAVAVAVVVAQRHDDAISLRTHLHEAGHL